MAKVCVFFAEGFEEVEALTVVDLLRRANQEVYMVSITGEKMICGSHSIKVEADSSLLEMQYDNVDMLVLPGGGPGTKRLSACKPLEKLLLDFYKKGKRIAAICAAPSILGDLGILEGKRAVCYPGFEAHLKGAVISENRIETDGNITTSRGVGTAIAFGLELIALLEGKEAAEEVKASILYGHS